MLLFDGRYTTVGTTDTVSSYVYAVAIDAPAAVRLAAVRRRPGRVRHRIRP